MVDVDLFLSLAEISGVFVGFGALISVSGGTARARELVYIRALVSIGLWVVIAGLAPVTISRYGIGGHDLWLLSSVLGLVLFVSVWAVNRRTPEHRDDLVRTPRSTPLLFAPVALITLGLMALAMILIVLDVLPNQESALYFSALVLALVAAGFALLTLVYRQRDDPELGAAPAE